MILDKAGTCPVFVGIKSGKPSQNLKTYDYYISLEKLKILGQF